MNVFSKNVYPLKKYIYNANKTCFHKHKIRRHVNFLKFVIFYENSKLKSDIYFAYLGLLSFQTISKSLKQKLMNAREKKGRNKKRIKEKNERKPFKKINFYLIASHHYW